MRGKAASPTVFGPCWERQTVIEIVGVCQLHWWWEQEGQSLREIGNTAREREREMVFIAVSRSDSFSWSNGIISLPVYRRFNPSLTKRHSMLHFELLEVSMCFGVCVCVCSKNRFTFFLCSSRQPCSLMRYMQWLQRSRSWTVARTSALLSSPASHPKSGSTAQASWITLGW